MEFWHITGAANDRSHSSLLFGFNSGKADRKATAFAGIEGELLISLEQPAQMLVYFGLRIIERLHALVAVTIRTIHRDLPITDVEEYIHHAFSVGREKARYRAAELSAGERCTQLDPGIPCDGHAYAERFSSPMGIHESGAEEITVFLLGTLQIVDGDHDAIHSIGCHETLSC